MIFKEPWALDNQWVRCELLDEDGKPLGLVYFERNDEDADNDPPFSDNRRADKPQVH